MKKTKKYFIIGFASLLCMIFLFIFETKLGLFNKNYTSFHWDLSTFQGIEVVKITISILLLSLLITVSSGVSAISFIFLKNEVSNKVYIISLSILCLIFVGIFIFSIINLNYLSDLIYWFYHSLLRRW